MNFVKNIFLNIFVILKQLVKRLNILLYSRLSQEVRSHLYTTNLVESINSMIEEILIKAGGYFKSIEILEINIFLQRECLKQSKWKNPIPKIKLCIYDIN